MISKSNMDNRLEDVTFSNNQYFFSSSNKLKEAISNKIISKYYETAIIKTDQTRDIMKCCNDNYKWKQHALWSQLTCIKNFIIQKFISKYTCISVELLDNYHVSISWIVNNMKNKLEDTLQYKVVDIKKDIWHNQSITVSYLIVWHWKEKGYF